MQTFACNMGAVALQAGVIAYRQQQHPFMSLGHLSAVKWIGNEQGINRKCTGDADRGCKQGMLNRGCSEASRVPR